MSQELPLFLKFKMEIERKFLIKEKTKKYPCPYNLKELKKEIKLYGVNIIQHYLPEKLSKEIFGILGFQINFIPHDLRIRKYGNDFFITLKSKGSIKRKEFERKISKGEFKILEKLKIKTVKKIRLIKNFQRKKIEFDYYKKHSLIIAEIEFNSLFEAKNFKTNMKEITGIGKYGNRNLAD